MRIPFRIHLLVALLILLCSTLVIIFLTSVNHSGIGPFKIHTVDTISVTKSGSVNQGAGWQKVNLPEDNYRQLDGVTSRLYRVTVPEYSADSDLSLLVTYSSRPIELLYNKSQIEAATGRTMENNHLGRKYRRATCLSIDRDQLNSENKITLNLRPDINHSSLMGEIHIGETHRLKNICQSDAFITETLVQLIIVTMILSAVFVSLLWVFRPKETVYFYYGVAVILWSIYSYGHLPLNLPVNTRIWDWIHLSALMYWPVTVIVFCNRFIGTKQPAVESGFIAYATVVCGFTLAIDEQYFYYFADTWWPLLSYVSGFYASWIMLRAVFTARTPSITWMTVCGMLIMVLSAHDIAVLAHWTPPQFGLLLHYAAALLVTVFTFILLQRFVEALHFAEELNRELAGTVQAKSSEVKYHLSALKKLERQQALANERNRIMRELHDGIGGDILSIRTAIEGNRWEKSEISNELANVQDELYLLIQSLDKENSSLAMALGKMRYRLEQRIELAGLRFCYSVTDIPDSLQLAHTQIIDILRIVQEAVTNAIKHADATIITLGLISQEQRGKYTIRVSVQDNGKGTTQDPTQGYGLANMHSRAKQIGAQISVNPLDPGTEVLLEFSLKSNTI